ncbi:hypothetical protein BDA99DRAFT_562219 [Phascolomyces articulosus]|uniref:DUF7721 domain-containing protein n=1 Tax=Phascolomyces articulosus TaxID=60185 RepID=A0AAD5K8G2_9FUNG|nr:hypothetical protein BDA99DRAFT_562219 [Phascolomyces articulosus]
MACAANAGHAADIAQGHAGGEADKGLLSSLISNVMGNSNNTPTSAADLNDINYAAQSYNKIYNENKKSSSVNGLGFAAAMKAFKLFTGKGASGGSDQILGFAMGSYYVDCEIFLTKEQGAFNPVFNILMGLVHGNYDNNNNQQQAPMDTNNIGSIASSVINGIFK